MKTKIKIGLCILLLIAAIPSVYALISPSPCNGNICIGTINVGGKPVEFEYTQHVKSDGVFKIRLNGGNYVADGRIVSYLVSDLPSFTTATVTPAPGAIDLPLEETNPTAIHRFGTGISGNVDFVIELTLDNAAEDEYNFHITVTHLGLSDTLMNKKLYVDASAPSNNEELEVVTPITGDYPCADDADNDLDYYKNCADNNCFGQPGNPADPTDLCEAVEITCNDEFDNDADRLTDCLDVVDCNGRPGNPLDPTENCEIPEIMLCSDDFDNDADGLTDCADDGCAEPDISPADGIADCIASNDCACPPAENLDAALSSQPAWCFNGVDDDFDNLIDCADPDCLGIKNPDIAEGEIEQICRLSEFDLLEYQLCNNGFDDDGDGDMDCLDPDCTRQFGSCGPCPEFEDVTYDSCADGKDNDADSLIDCADTDECEGELGSISNAAWCAEVENTDQTCTDKLDNDGNGNIDCQDSQCSGKGPAGQKCQHMKEINCGDAFDNDGDGFIDCIDPDCFAPQGPCSAEHTTASCITVPEYDPLKTFIFNSPTISAKQFKNVRAGAKHEINVIGTATYQSLSIFLGDAVNLNNAYPYDATSCTISGAGASQMTYTSSADGNAGQLQNILAEGDIQGFNMVISCDTSALPQEAKTYKIIVVAARSDGQLEMGEQTFTTTLYEGDPPAMAGIEVEGIEAGEVNIKTGDSVRFRAIPEYDISGTCACTFDIGGDIINSVENCIASVTFTEDTPSLSIKASAEDGADNIGPYSASQTIKINVAPEVTDDLKLDKTKPFYKTGTGIILDAGFTTATNGNFPLSSECQAIIRDSAGIIYPYLTTTIGKSSTGNTITCDGTIPVPTKGDGTYLVEVTVTEDNDGDSVTSSKKPFFVCDRVDSTLGEDDPCRFADFDQDGASEGIFTELYIGPLRCDNCPDASNPTHYNPEQIDLDANGVGDVCEGYFSDGDVTGTVTCEEVPVNVEGAQVCHLDNCVETDANGLYTIYNVPMGLQTLIASNIGNKSERGLVDVKPRETVPHNFEKVCPITIDCNPDCTTVGTETEAYPTCDPRCDEVSGCKISSNEYASCEYAYKGLRIEYLNESDDDTRYYMICCEGEHILMEEEEEEKPPKLEVDAENIARTTRIVYHDGKPVKMVIVTWD